ncbi:MAG: 30S ribosomal protein S20 [Treponema sp.]|nr:30S ribosomal protein S20 [Treponema sp.]
MSKNKTSAEKRHEQSEVRRMRNRAVKSRCHTSAKKFLAAIQQKDQNLAQEAYRALQSELDNAKRKGVIKSNACSRKKSRMAILLNKTFAAKTVAN